MKKSFKSHLLFTKQQRDGILLLVIVIGALILALHFFEFSEESIFDMNSPEVRSKLDEIDSLRAIEEKSRTSQIYPFNPNFITDFKAYTLGMSPTEFDRLKEYRSANKWINSAQEFQKVTQVSDTLLAQISTYFKFPEWISKPKKVYNFSRNEKSHKTFFEKKDLNTATANQLESTFGVGKALSRRIIDFREEIGGFSNDVQLYGVWGLSGETADRVMQNFTVKSPVEIKKMDINLATASDISTIPGVSFDFAKLIWEFRTLNQRIIDLSVLKNIEGMTEYKLKLINLYLYVE